MLNPLRNNEEDPHPAAEPPGPAGRVQPGLLVEHGGSSTLYLTGQLAVDPEGKVVARSTLRRRPSMSSASSARFSRRGMDFGDVVKVDTFLTHMPDFEKFSAVRNRFFADSRPVSTLLEVKGLAREGCCVEIEVTAVK